MDLSPKSLREVEFREKLRGYHPEDVDEFLEQVAAGLEALQERLRQATERAVHAEQLAAESGVNDESIRRTLVLAQRTADMAIEEAREQAASIVADAEERVRTILTAGHAEAEEMARRAQADLRADIERLTTARDQLRGEVDAVESWLAEHRQSLALSLTDALGRLEEGLVAAPPPETKAVDIPAPPPPAPDAVVEPPVAAGAVDGAGDGGVAALDSAVRPPEGAVRPADGEAGASVPTPFDHSDADATGEVPAVERPDYVGPSAGDAVDAAGSGDDDGASDAHDTGAASSPEPGADGDDDDPFLAELRR